MKTILVDDEAIMLHSFERQSEGIEGLELVGKFQFPDEALAFAQENTVDLALLDIKMPIMSGIELAKELRRIRNDMLIVFITAYDEYIAEANVINADYYIMKPYRRETIRKMVDRMQTLSKGQKKDVYVQMFGRFVVLKKGRPIPLNGKAKEILALIAAQCGKEISNEDIYSRIWENREHDNIKMKVYYNAVRRLKDTLSEAGLSDLLISTTRGQIFNTDMVDCDYYSWRNDGNKSDFDGTFLSEYSWGEYILASLVQK